MTYSLKSDSHVSARATLSNGRTVKQNGGGTVVFRATQDIRNFEMVFEI
jgi:hypothetical protein